MPRRVKGGNASHRYADASQRTAIQQAEQYHASEEPSGAIESVQSRTLLTLYLQATSLSISRPAMVHKILFWSGFGTLPHSYT